MGMRTAPYIAQRVSDAITYIHQKQDYYLLNYVDDFVGAEIQQKIWNAFFHLKNLLERLCIDASPEKMVAPMTRLEFLGITYDTQLMTIELPQGKIADILHELDKWLYKTKVTRTQVESLVGKLQFASKFIRPVRIFISRMIGWLRTMNRHDNYTIPLTARKDLAWWRRFLSEYNGVSIMWLYKTPQADKVLSNDACPEGFGAICNGQFLQGFFPKHMKKHNIAYLEMRAVIVALKTFASQLRGQYFLIQVDNEAVAQVLNSGASRDEFLQDALREVAYLAAQFDFIIKARHIMGILNRVLDWLSRWGSREARDKFAKYARGKNLQRLDIGKDMLEFQHTW